MINYELRLIEINKNWMIKSIKAVKDGTRLGLKESKDIIQAVIDGGEPVLYDGSNFNTASRIMKELDIVNAEYQLNNYY